MPRPSNDTFDAFLAARWREARKLRGVTQAEVAAKLDVNDGTISFIETARQRPSVPLLHVYCKAYSISSDWLLGLQ